MHAANRAAWDEAAERYEGWFDEAVALIRSGGTNLFGVETELIGDLHGRCRRAIHLQCAGGRDTLSLWNQGADEVVGVDFSPRMLDAGGTPERGHRGARRAGSRPTSSRHRPSSMARPTSSTPAAARSSGSRTWTPGRPSSPASSPRPVDSSCSRGIRPSGCSTPTRMAAGSRPTTTTSVAPRRRRAGRPSTSTGCRSRSPTRAGSSRGPGRSARSSPRCWAPTCASRRSPSTRSTGGAATPTCATTSAAGSRCRSRWWGARAAEPRLGDQADVETLEPPSSSRSTRLTATIAAAVDRAVDVRIRRTRDVVPPRDVERVEVERQRQERPRIGGVVAVERLAQRRRRHPCSG